MKRIVEIFHTPYDFMNGAAKKVADLLITSIDSRGLATVALSGGTTPRNIYEQLGKGEFTSGVDWTKVHLFWGDERCVPPTSSESNYRLVRESLLAHVAVPEKNVHRIMTEKAPRDAALQYEQVVEDFFGLSEDQFPEFDIVLLGLGNDGHTASLFPESQVLNERSRLVVETFASKLAQHRITLTLPVINNARVVLFFVSGAEKAIILRDVLESDAIQYPAQLVRPFAGQVYWLVDREAASHLQSGSYS